MKNTTLSRRDLVELFLGGSKNKNYRTKTIEKIDPNGSLEGFSVFWGDGCETGKDLPLLVISPNDQIHDLFVAANSSPNAPSPISSLCRIITQEEAGYFFSRKSTRHFESMLPVVSAASIVEAMLHLGASSVGFKQVSPALCKRTLSYAWGRALSASAPLELTQDLTKRWLETHELLHTRSSTNIVRGIVEATSKVLELCTRVLQGGEPVGPADAMALAMLNNDAEKQASTWRSLIYFLGDPIELKDLMSLTREDRGTYLQKAIKISEGSLNSSGYDSETMSAACAFIATKVAPGSLEHFDVLRKSSSPSSLIWYALFASLGATQKVLSFQNGLGLRVLRDIRGSEDCFSRPVSDIAYHELKLFQRVGLDSILNKLGHIGEIEVELLPFVTTSFSQYSKMHKPRSDLQQSLDFEDEKKAISLRNEAKSVFESKSRLKKLLYSLEEVVRSMPDEDDFPDKTPRKPRRK